MRLSNRLFLLVAGTVVPLVVLAVGLGALLVDPTTRRCPTPVGTDAWLRVLGYFGLEDLDEALR